MAASDLNSGLLHHFYHYSHLAFQPPGVLIALEIFNGSPLGFGLSWMIGKDDFGKFYYHDGGGATIETVMRFYPDLDLGVMVMGSVNGYRSEQIAEGLVSAWMNEK